MAFKKSHRLKNIGCRRSVIISLVISVLTPLIFLAARAGSFTLGPREFPDWPRQTLHSESARRLSALEHTNEVANTAEGLNLNIVGGKDLSSSLVLEESADVSRNAGIDNESYQAGESFGEVVKPEAVRKAALEHKFITLGKIADFDAASAQRTVSNPPPAKETEVIQQYNDTNRRKSDKNPMMRTLRDQLILGKAYATLAQAQSDTKLLLELKAQNKEIQEILAEIENDEELPSSIQSKIKSSSTLLDKAKNLHYDCNAMVKKLRAMLHATEQEGRMLKKQSVYLSQLAAKTIPKGLHCLAMRLSVEYYARPHEERQLPHQERLEDPQLYHYALFSDNILATSVVVNSTITHAKEPEKHVFHLVTDKLNYGAMKMWFIANPPGNAAIEVQNVDDFKWLNSSYSPVLRQLESVTMKEYYFRANNPAASSGLKYRNPKYLSMLNHLRFYLPEIYPKLDKIVFLDDDIVVQKDLTPLWFIDLKGNVNGAVETCGKSFHRFDKYLNFSNPLISKNFDPNACGWAYGMNVFDLSQWKHKDITGIYHRWQNLNEDRSLWRLGTLPPGLITFYNLTFPLNKYWHVLGLGYNEQVKGRDIRNAAVIHYNGNMKPWLEIGMAKYKPYWSRHVKYDHVFVQQCNINE